ncbi:type III secretion system inner membrane ring lipoprotein SctJ [Tatumella ptyseos]|uniref:type III secretion system inner membrane ring lipoprotein SctJ n=1 Tax=Tatumella ptyseos TaxID=82987 RepID=UPI0026EA8666|nr:type III secretion inner membrane ring lipoprotein SctJ [Tatumella ptyseos]WKX28059.1 type III secretion inner membrane ring lipoprotein SctJ [Tatumella ptyseos]
MVKKLCRYFPIVIMILLLSGCDNETILFNLTQGQANQVLAILQQHNIAASKTGTLKAGYTVNVSRTESTAALSIVNQYQLPWSAEVQIAQAFPESALVSSPHAEQARVLSLQEQRIEQSLRLISQVVNARVHVSYPSFSQDFNKKTTPGHVGVMLMIKGEVNEGLFITQIKTLIKNSFNDIRYENISVVLFPAPVIQHRSSSSYQTEFPILWVMVGATLIVMIIAAASYGIYRVRYRRLSSDTQHAPITSPGVDKQ